MSEIGDRAWRSAHERYGASVRLILLGVSALAVLAMAVPSMAKKAATVTPATAQPRAPKVFRDCADSDCPQMVRLPGGTFQMGDGSGDGEADAKKPVYAFSGGGEGDNKPAHSVTLGAFAIGKYEVTRGEYAAFTRESDRAIGGDCYALDSAGSWKKQPSATWQSPGFSQSERDPVTCISWDDAEAYVAWLSQKTGHQYRLPSESEWEYAARGGSTSTFWWGDGDNDICDYANSRDQTLKQKFSSWTDASSCSDGHLYTAPVGSYRPNGFGLFDMAGNVWEWVEDCYAATYNLQPRNGAAYASETCPSRVFRGGAWDNIPGGLRSAYRRRISPTGRFGAGGFRVARSL